MKQEYEDLNKVRLAGPRPTFYEDPTRYNENSSEFINNIPWQREFFHGVFEAAQRKDFHRLRNVAVTVIQTLFNEDIFDIEGMNEAYVKGMRVGQALFGALEKEYGH